MKKQFLKGLMMLVLIISMAFVTAVVSANAQGFARVAASGIANSGNAGQCASLEAEEENSIVALMFELLGF